MARIRTIKPEFWTSAQVLECSTNARLLFIGLWNFADDTGRHPDSEKQCKAEVFPADDFTLSDVRGMLDELSGNGLIVRYVVDGKGFFQITGWHHQRIDKPQSAKYPGMDQSDSKNDTGTLPPEGKGKDTKGKEDTTAAAQPTGGDERFEEFKAAYPKRAGSQPWPRARKAINARLREGNTWDEIMAGVARYAAFCEATGKVGTETVLQAATFCGPDKRFLEPFDPPRGGNGQRLGMAQPAPAEAFQSTEDEIDEQDRVTRGW